MPLLDLAHINFRIENPHVSAQKALSAHQGMYSEDSTPAASPGSGSSSVDAEMKRSNSEPMFSTFDSSCHGSSCESPRSPLRSIMKRPSLEDQGTKLVLKRSSSFTKPISALKRVFSRKSSSTRIRFSTTMVWEYDSTDEDDC